MQNENYGSRIQYLGTRTLVPLALLVSKEFKPKEKMFLFALIAEAANADCGETTDASYYGWVTFSYPEIADICGCTPRSAQTMIKRLAARGAIEKAPGIAAYHPNHYRPTQSLYELLTAK